MFIDFVQQGRLNTLLACYIDKFTESDRIIDALFQLVIRSNSLMKAVEPFFKCHMDKRNDECRRKSILEHQARTDGMIHAMHLKQTPMLPTRSHLNQDPQQQGVAL